MTEIWVAPFEEVEATFAADEGEGDLSLAHCRGVHLALFARECERLGRRPSLRMPVVYMRFRAVQVSDG